MRDYYEILGLSRDADADAVKKAYRKLALEYHPDRNNGSKAAEQKFKEATQAYEVLRDPEKRAAYDRYGHSGVRGAGAGAGYGGFDFSDALEIFMRDFGGFGGFEDLFGGRRSRRSGARTRRGADHRLRMPITLKEVASGARKRIRYEVLDPCGACSGSGAEGGAAPVRCSTCGGAGEVRQVQRSFLGQLMTVTPCPACRGEGQRIEDKCRACGGRGVAAVEATREIDIPPGVSTGDYVTVRGAGNAGVRGGPRGDLIIMLEVEEDPRFIRDGPDLLHEIRITVSQAALGTEVDVPTVTGTAKLKVPAGTQSGTLLRMRSRGLPHLQGGGRGDQIVRVVVWTPTELTREQERLFRELAAIESPPPAESGRDAEDSFWNRVRSAFGT